MSLDLNSESTAHDSIRLAVLDWAGTTVDYGCVAPAAVFVEGFRRQGVTIRTEEARGPMGMEKRAHIRTLGEQPRIAEAWQAAHGQPMGEADVDAMYADFVPLLLAVLEDSSDLIPGVNEAMAELAALGVRVAASTGYFVEAMEVVAAAAARQGYRPEFTISANQVAAGRPAPWMIYRAMEALNIYPPQVVVAVGDTVPDIQAGRNARVWTVAFAQTGNEVGLARAEFEALPAATRAASVAQARATLTAAGAHLVVDGIWALPAAIATLNARLRAGERP
jgi:phosphonoacetaldehyde hydrolase